MPPLEELLRRFRPIVAPPGGAGGAAIPVDRTAELLGELTEVLATVDLIEEEVAGLQASASATVAERLGSARAQAARIVARAGEEAPGERAAAYAERCQAGESGIRRDIESAEQEARRIRATAAERMPELTATVLLRVVEAVEV